MVMKRTTEQIIINESIRRMEKGVEEELRLGKIPMLTDAPEFVKRMMEPMMPLMVVLSRIALLSRWN